MKRDVPKSAFNFFTKEMYPIVRDENPEMSFFEINVEKNKRWRAISQEDKEKYQAMAKESKKEFRKRQKRREELAEATS